MLITKIKEGDIKRLPNKRGADFTVKVVKVYECDGEQFAEVEPVGFNGAPREVKACMLFD